MVRRAQLLSVMLLIAAVVRAAGAAAQEPIATGRMTLTFTEHGPLSERELVYRRMGQEKIPPINAKYPAEFDLSTEPFDVFVPPGYRGDMPHGIFVWMGVTDPSPVWFDVLARHRMIFLFAKMNNPSIENGEVRKALDGIFNLKKKYKIDETRIYISGFSGGAAKASWMICAFPDVFRGALFLMGGGFYARSRDDNGHLVPSANFLDAWKGPIDPIKRDYPVVIVRGQNEPYGDWANANYEGLLLDGFVKAVFFEIPRIGHNHPDAAWFEKAINAMDHPVLKKPPTTGPTNDAHPLPTQLAQAQRYIVSAKHWQQWRSMSGSEKLADERTREALQRVMRDYPTTPAAARAKQMLATLFGDGSSATPTTISATTTATSNPAGASGHVQLILSEHSPLSAPEVYAMRTEAEPLLGAIKKGKYELKNEPVDVVVPADYTAERKTGLLVWMGEGYASPEWAGVLGRRNLMLVSIRPGRQDYFASPRLALDAVHNLKKLYSVDEKRIYLCGFGGGANMASYLIHGYSDVFGGGVFLMGAEFYQLRPDERGRRVVGAEGYPAWQGPIEEIKKNVSLVLVSGQNDKDWEEIHARRADLEGLQLDGFVRVSHIEVPGIGHNPPDAAWFEKAIVALEETTPRTAPTTRPTKGATPAPSQIAQAARLLVTARYYLNDDTVKSMEDGRKKGWARKVTGDVREYCREKARGYLRSILNDYPTTPAATKARQLMAEVEYQTKTKSGGGSP